MKRFIDIRRYFFRKNRCRLIRRSAALQLVEVKSRLVRRVFDDSSMRSSPEWRSCEPERSRAPLLSKKVEREDCPSLFSSSSYPLFSQFHLSNQTSTRSRLSTVLDRPRVKKGLATFLRGLPPSFSPTYQSQRTGTSASTSKGFTPRWCLPRPPLPSHPYGSL